MLCPSIYGCSNPIGVEMVRGVARRSKKRRYLGYVVLLIGVLSILSIIFYLLNTHRDTRDLEKQFKNIDNEELENPQELMVLHASIFCENYEDGYVYGNCIFALILKNNTTEPITIYGIAIPQIQINLVINTVIDVNEVKKISVNFNLNQKNPVVYLFNCYLITSLGRIKLEPSIAI
ncbi:MAG: hypothetical protein QXX52_07630 [Ignisphaera sp.]